MVFEFLGRGRYKFLVVWLGGGERRVGKGVEW